MPACRARVVRLAPRVEPAGEVRAAHQRSVRAQLAQGLEARARIAAELDRGQEALARAAGELRGPVAGRQRHVEARRAQLGLEAGEVLRILAAGAVLVLDLQHQDRAAARHLQAGELAADAPQVALDRRQVARIARAQLQVRLLEQPGREAAQVPLRAGVGAGPQQHPQAFLLRHSAEARDVRGALEVELARPRLVLAPEQRRSRPRCSPARAPSAAAGARTRAGRAPRAARRRGSRRAGRRAGSRPARSRSCARDSARASARRAWRRLQPDRTASASTLLGPLMRASVAGPARGPLPGRVTPPTVLAAQPRTPCRRSLAATIKTAIVFLVLGLLLGAARRCGRVRRLGHAAPALHRRAHARVCWSASCSC
jgi:hypothetical protein